MTSVRRGVLTLACAGVALLAAGCGDEAETAAGPVEAVPDEAVLYAEVVLRPEDEQGERLEALAGRVLGTDDAGGELAELFDAGVAEGGSELTYEEDIAPWLGERGALVFTSLADEAEFEDAGAFVVETTDADAARDLLERAADESDTETSEESHAGVDYLLDDEGVAGGVADGLLIFGAEALFQSAVDTLDGDPALADEEAFSDQLDEQRRADSAASLYVDLAAAIEASGDQLDPGDAEVLDRIAPNLISSPVVGTLAAADSEASLELEFGSLGELAAASAVAPGPELLRELPGDAWAASGTADAGAAYSRLVELVASGGLPDADPSELRELERETGLDLERALEAVGDVAGFVRGSSIDELEGAVVAEIRDPAAVSEALAVVQREAELGPGERIVTLPPDAGEGFALLSPEIPRPIEVVLRDDRLVVAYGSRARADALAPPSTLGESEAFSAATESLGDVVPNTFVDLEPVLELLRGSPLVLIDGFDDAMPYLERLDYAAAAGTDNGERARLDLVVGVE